MSTLVLGASGFVGSATVDALQKNGLEISILSNTQRLGAGKKIIIDKKVDSVMHLAWDSQWIDKKSLIIRNRKITNDIINLIECSNVKKIVFASSMSVYGSNSYGIIDEKCGLSCDSFYGKSKIEAEQSIIDYSTDCGMNYVILRYSSVYGPRQKGGFVSDTFKKVLNSSQIILDDVYSDFVFVDDVANSNLISLRYNCNGIFNIGYGKSIKRSEVARLIKNISNSKSKIKILSSSEMPYIVNLSKAKEDLGYVPKVDIVEGLKKTFKWYSKEMMRPF